MYHTSLNHVEAAVIDVTTALACNQRTLKYPNLIPPENLPIHISCIILRQAVDSAAEAEVGELFHNGKMSIPLSITLN